ncbi:MAG: hypothetical protein ACI35W_02195 [Anaeroplasmataceae bacterium]
MKNKEMTEKQSKERIVEHSKTVLKVLNVLKVIAIVGCALCFILSVVSFILFGTGALTKLYEAYPKIGNVKVEIDRYFGELDNSTIKELYEANLLDKLALAMGIYLCVGGIYCIVFSIIISLFKPLFNSISNSETPFNNEVLKKFKTAFILIFIMVIFESVLVGLIVGAVLMCIYFIFIYGIKMQENEDRTL